MNSKNFVCFVLGFALGVVMAEKYFSRTYEQMADKEIEIAKEVYEKKERALERKYERSEQAEIIRENEYSVEDVYDSVEAPYPITEDELGDVDDYTIVILSYYDGNKVLTDENDDIVEDPDDILGQGALNAFGHIGTDAIWIRNDRRKCDYEVLRVEGCWENPYLYDT